MIRHSMVESADSVETTWHEHSNANSTRMVAGVVEPTIQTSGHLDDEESAWLAERRSTWHITSDKHDEHLNSTRTDVDTVAKHSNISAT